MKYDLIAEAYMNLLIEGRIDDLKKQNPNLTDVIDKYTLVDPTSQKKFVSWLLSQHKKGNVTPDEHSLSSTLSGFETYKSKHKIKDHSSKSYQEIKNAVEPHLGTAATKKELKKQQLHDGIEHIYSSPDNKIHAFHVKTKEASQHVYGGGTKLGGLHTGWCVSARSKGCLFGDYGTMYTIHAKDDPKSPYAVHMGGRGDLITTRDNNPEEDEFGLDEGLKKFPHLIGAANAIKTTHSKFIAQKLKNKDSNIDSSDLTLAANHLDPEVALAALNHHKADFVTVSTAAKHPNPKVALAALNHHKADTKTTYIVASHPDSDVALAALNHPKADIGTISSAASNNDPKIAIAALNNPSVSEHAVSIAASHSSLDVVLAALRHPNVSDFALANAAMHSNPAFVMTALNHPKANAFVTVRSAMNPRPEVALAALNHPKATDETVYVASHHPSPEVVLAALNHPKASDVTISAAKANNHPGVQDAIKHLIK